MKNYELLYIVSNQYTEDEKEQIKKKINATIEKYGGAIGYEEFLGKKKLAYPIKKILHGYYQAAEFALADETKGETKLAQINNELRLDKEIIRAQIIIKPPMTAAEIKRKKDRAFQDRTHPAGERIIYAKEKKKTEEAVKIKTKNLDEKLAEILKDDNIL